MTCERLTYLELKQGSLSLQSWMTLMKGLHNLRAVRLQRVSVRVIEVSDLV